MTRTDPMPRVFLPEHRATTISRWGSGNNKLWPDGTPGCYSFSKSPVASCPGSTPWCESKCYAIRAELNNRVMDEMWDRNLLDWEPAFDEDPLPADATLVRMHVSGDFDSRPYIQAWIGLALARPDVTFWGYTRSWQVAKLLPGLENLRALPNVQLFASVDENTGPAPEGWRVADVIPDHAEKAVSKQFLCPEEFNLQPNCLTCRYCFDGQRGNVTFLEH